MNFTVYKSSAGSGKTFTLVKEYLKLILPEPGKYRNILAITFTNKAANEMKDRVLFSLKELAKPSAARDPKVNQILLPLLMSETGLEERQISNGAGEALKQILHNYSDFAIGTIDSFSHRIIRTFAHDFGLPVNFNIELDKDELLESAIDLVLDKAGDDKELTDILVKFLESRIDEDKGWQIESILFEFAQILLSETGIRHLEKLKDLKLHDFERIISSIYSQINDFENRIMKMAREATDLIHKNDIPLASFYYGENGIGGYLKKLANKKMDSIKSDTFAFKTVTENKWTSGNASPDDIQKIGQISVRLGEIYMQIRHYRELNYSRYIFLKLVTQTIYPLAVLNAIDQTLTAFKKQNNIVHISEFNRRIAEIVLNEPVPFIYERLGERFNHILIDEFQDTSKLQWNNLQPLIENSLASGHFNLVVGDGKQAIYRWRNGDVDQFTSLPAIPGSNENMILKERERILAQNFSSRPLKENFRSKYEIIDFNNRFFSFLSQKYPLELKEVYDDPVQENAARPKGGYVNIEFIDHTDDEFSYKEKSLNRILERIRELENHKFRWRDIAILCRRNREGAEIAGFLLQHGIRVVSSEALLLSHSPEVNFIVGVMRLLHDSRNLLLIAELVTYLYRKGILKNTGLHRILSELTEEPHSNTLLRILEDHQFLIDIIKLSVLPVFELAEELIRIFSLNAATDPYLLFFLDAVMKYSRKNPTSTSSFLEWWDTKRDKLSVITPEGPDAVRIMTVHKSKGLQFPVVIHPFAIEKKDTSRTYLWVDIPDNDLMGLKCAIVKAQNKLRDTDYKNEFEDEERKSLIDLVNLLYVAMTRAEERLYILTKPAPGNDSEIESVPVFFDLFFKSEKQWIKGKTEYESGQAVDHLAKEKNELQGSVPHSSFISNDWRNRVFIRARAPRIWDVREPEKQNHWGKLLHTVLSGITSINDFDAVMENVFSSGMLEENEKMRLKNTVKAILNHPVSGQLFSEGLKVKMETEILLKDGRVLRPDRIIIDSENIIIVDYKTGKPDEKHKKQMKDYEAVLSDLGYKEIRKLILYNFPDIQVLEIE